MHPKSENHMKKIIDKLKRRSGTIILAIIGLFAVFNPTFFLTLGGDVAMKIIMAVLGLLLFNMAISQADRHWSHPDPEKKVSLSKFMANEANSNQRMVIYAVLLISVAVILAAVIVG